MNRRYWLRLEGGEGIKEEPLEPHELEITVKLDWDADYQRLPWVIQPNSDLSLTIKLVHELT